jgi:hypothetical protein
LETKITVTTKIRCNGQDYASGEEMPADVRRAYEQAMASLKISGGVQGGRSSTKILLNGMEYGSVEEMPTDVRQLYERAICSVAANGATGSGNRSTARTVLFLISLLGLGALAWLIAVRGWPIQ